MRRPRATVNTHQKQFSIEIFPAKTPAGKESLDGVCDVLNSLNPTFFSCTYGASGSTRDTTMGQVKSLIAKGIDTAPHLSFGGDDESSIVALLQTYKDLGVQRIVALRGDLPPGIDGTKQLVHADYLVKLIRREFGEHFEIEVAAYPEIHPEAESFSSDVAFLKGKFDAGANSAITQYFFNPDSYFYFLEECLTQGISQPIYPGIMPLNNFEGIMRFSKNCGADIPRWLSKKMASFNDDLDSRHAFGVDFITSMCEQLLDGGAPGLHFYSMNQVEPVKTIWENLKLS
jgi:methylenetetrahydrofolate reductase (NADPH)